ncbi:MAG TPA: type II toxin-antitoxin system VapC family toxin [Gemmatimonadales bacterium]|jgi:PIN domain nuclease of toxin-antitoxin system
MIVLDTHAWIWWVSDPSRIPRRSRARIERASSGAQPLYVSAISVWELAMLVEHGRLTLSLDVADWLARAEAAPDVEFVPVDNRVALRAVRLHDFPHKDPADRLIVSTALGLGATLVTADQRLHRYKPLPTLWD